MKKSFAYILLFLLLPTLLIGTAALVLLMWHIPSQVQVGLTVNRVVFNVAGDEARQILTPVRVRSVTAERFAHLDFRPEQLEVANPAQYNLEEDRYPESAWTVRATGPLVVITPKGEELQPAVTLERETPALKTVGTLDGLWGQPGARVTLETNQSSLPSVRIAVEDQQPSTVLSMRDRFLVIIDHGRFSGIKQIPYETDSLAYRVRLPSRAPTVEITGEPHSLVLVVAVSENINLFSNEAIPIKSIDFTRQEGNGAPKTSLVGEGTITYPDYSQIKAVPFKAPDFLTLDLLDKFYITEMTLDPKTKGIHLGLHGIAGSLKTGSRDFPVDHRLTVFDTLWQSRKLVVLASIIAWAFSATVGAYKLYKEISKEVITK